MQKTDEVKHEIDDFDSQRTSRTEERIQEYNNLDDEGLFTDTTRFWQDQANAPRGNRWPIHYHAFCARCLPAMASSSIVEGIFTGAGTLTKSSPNYRPRVSI